MVGFVHSFMIMMMMMIVMIMISTILHEFPYEYYGDVHFNHFTKTFYNKDKILVKICFSDNLLSGTTYIMRLLMYKLSIKDIFDLLFDLLHYLRYYRSSNG